MAPRKPPKPKETPEEKAARKAVRKAEKKASDLAKISAMHVLWQLIKNLTITPEAIAAQAVATCGIDCKYIYRKGGIRCLAGKSPLQLSIMAKRFDVAKIFVLAHSANVESRDSAGVSALRTAINSNNLELVRLLVDDGHYDLKHGIGSGGPLPLHFAMKNRFMPIVDYLYSRCPLPGTLQYAIGTCKDIEMVKYLLSKGCDVNGEYEGDTPLTMAIRYSYELSEQAAVALVLLLVNGGADLRVKISLSTETAGFTLLHFCGRYGRPSVATLLIDLGLPINALDSKGRTPLATAIEFRKWTFSLLVINAGADVNVSWQGTTALHLACSTSRTQLILSLVDHQLIMALLDHGASVNAISGEGDTPLAIIAKQSNRYNYDTEALVVEALLQHGADPNISSANSGEAPLHRSIPVDIARLLIEKSANINAIDYEGNTPLLSALRRLHNAVTISKTEYELDLVVLFLSFNADLTIISNNGDSAANYFAELPSCAVKALLDADLIRLDSMNENGLTPLQQSFEQGSGGKALMCIEYGANISGRHFDGRTSLSFACRSRHSDSACTRLVDTGAEINEMETYKTTPLLTALENRNREAALYLLANGADYLTANAQGKTPLHLAVTWDYLDIVKILVAQGAPINELDENGQTLLQRASYVSPDVLQYLLEKGVTL